MKENLPPQKGVSIKIERSSDLKAKDKEAEEIYENMGLLDIRLNGGNVPEGNGEDSRQAEPLVKAVEDSRSTEEQSVLILQLEDIYHKKKVRIIAEEINSLQVGYLLRLSKVDAGQRLQEIKTENYQLSEENFINIFEKYYRITLSEADRKVASQKISEANQEMATAVAKINQEIAGKTVDITGGESPSEKSAEEKESDQLKIDQPQDEEESGRKPRINIPEGAPEEQDKQAAEEVETEEIIRGMISDDEIKSGKKEEDQTTALGTFEAPYELVELAVEKTDKKNMEAPDSPEDEFKIAENNFYTSKKNYFDKYKECLAKTNSRKFSKKVSSLFSQEKEDISEINAAKEQYDIDKLVYAKALLTRYRSSLDNSHGEEQVNEKLAEYKAQVLYQKLIVFETIERQNLEISNLPEKKHGFFKKAWQQYAEFSSKHRVLSLAISASLVTGAVAMSGGFASTGAMGAALFGVGRISRGGLGVFIGMRAGRLAEKKSEKVIEKKQSEANNRLKKKAAETNLELNDIKYLEEEYQRLCREEKSFERKKVAAKILVSMACGIWAAAGLNMLDSAYANNKGQSVSSNKLNIPTQEQPTGTMGAVESQQPDSAYKVDKNYNSPVSEKLAQSPEKISAKSNLTQNAVPDSSIIGRGQGVEHVFKQQLLSEPDKFGFKGSQAELHAWADTQAHRTALEHGYVDATTGKEIRVGGGGIGRAAYVLEADSQGKVTGVKKFIDGDLKTGRDLSHEYEHVQQGTDTNQKTTEKPAAPIAEPAQAEVPGAGEILPENKEANYQEKYDSLMQNLSQITGEPLTQDEGQKIYRLLHNRNLLGSDWEFDANNQETKFILANPKISGPDFDKIFYLYDQAEKANSGIKLNALGEYYQQAFDFGANNTKAEINYLKFMQSQMDNNSARGFLKEAGLLKDSRDLEQFRMDQGGKRMEFIVKPHDATNALKARIVVDHGQIKVLNNGGNFLTRFLGSSLKWGVDEKMPFNQANLQKSLEHIYHTYKTWE